MSKLTSPLTHMPPCPHCGEQPEGPYGYAGIVYKVSIEEDGTWEYQDSRMIDSSADLFGTEGWAVWCDACREEFSAPFETPIPKWKQLLMRAMELASWRLLGHHLQWID